MTTAPLTFHVPAGAPPIEHGFLNLGHWPHPQHRLTVNSRHLALDGRPWMPVMGEFHYSRCPAGEWATELRKMRAGGIDIVASYVIWNHHEPEAGQFRWDGQRNLRRFIATAADCGLRVYLRPGPWAHAEVRLGGFPAWLPADGTERSNDPAYLAAVARFFNAVGEQVQGLRWCDGGPVLGVQLENEYGRTGPGCGAEHIAELKRLAIAAGLTVPLYTVTGWPTLDIPPTEVLPVSGAYADGFWQGARGPLPPSGVFLFNTQRVIGEMGNVDGTPAAAHVDKTHYPFFLAEAGGGMHQAYHRRPVVSEPDVYATTLVQLGSGATLYGYYMYHGGTNPACHTGPLNETQRSGYPNDVPEWGYDFHAPLGEYGQVRPRWGQLRCLHQFMQAFGPELALAEPLLPDGGAHQPEDLVRPRLSWRGIDDAGFLFVNHHVRHHLLPPLGGLQVTLDFAARPGAAQTLPSRPFALQPGDAFIWPVGQRLGGARLAHATVQPLTRWTAADGAVTWVGFSLPGQPIELAFDAATVQGLQAPEATLIEQGSTRLLRLAPVPETTSGANRDTGTGTGTAAALDAAPRQVLVTDRAGLTHRLLILTHRQAEATLCTPLGGAPRLVVSSHPATVDGQGQLEVHHPAHEAAWARVFPADGLATAADAGARANDAPAPAAPPPASLAHWPGFLNVQAPARRAATPVVQARLLRPAGPTPAPLQGPALSWRDGPVALVPEESAHAAAALWQLDLPTDVHPADGRLLVALQWRGDIARLQADGLTVTDHFNDGAPWWLGLDRHARADGTWPAFTLSLLPLGDDARLFVEPEARGRLAGAEVLACPATLQVISALPLRASAPATASVSNPFAQD